MASECKIVRGHCPRCASDRKAYVRCEHVVHATDEDDGTAASDTGMILECCGCECNLGPELAALCRRDISRLLQQIEAFPDDGTLWRRLDGMTNSAGNLALHLEGNLREYIGRQLGGIAYTRHRDFEFASQGQSVKELAGRIRGVLDMAPAIVAAADLDLIYPEEVLGVPLTTRAYLIHTHGHLTYHLGQIDTIRRALTHGGALDHALLRFAQ